MGLFISNCPACEAEIAWFLRAPQSYVCKCGRPVSPEEIEASWDENYRTHLERCAAQREDWTSPNPPQLQAVEEERDMGFRNHDDDGDDEPPIWRDSTGRPVPPSPATDPFRYCGAWDYAPRDDD